MSLLSKWLSKTFGVPEIHITTAEAVNSAVAVAKVAVTDELTGKADELIPDLITAFEASAAQVLENHLAAAATPAAPSTPTPATPKA